MKVVKSSKFSHLNGTLTLKVKIEKYKIRLAYSIQLRLNTEWNKEIPMIVDELKCY